MTTRHLYGLFALALLLGAATVRAQSIEEEKLAHTKMRPQEEEPEQTLSLSYRAGFLISGKFDGVGSVNPYNLGPAKGPGNRTYADGFVKIDSTTNSHGPFSGKNGATWFWGYVSSSQHISNSPTQDYLVMHSDRTTGADLSAENTTEDPLHGFELTYRRKLGKIGRGTWGVEAGLGFTSVSIIDNRPLSVPVVATADAYSLFFQGGVPPNVVPPAPPYTNTFGGGSNPPLLHDNPLRTNSVESLSAGVTGDRDFRADVWGFRVGPYIEYPLGHRFSASLNGGLAVMFVDSKFSFNESVALPAESPLLPAVNAQRAGSSWNTGFLYGPYIAGDISYALSRKLKIFSGAQFQDVGTYYHNLNGRAAQLDLSSAVFWTIGLGYNF